MTLRQGESLAAHTFGLQLDGVLVEYLAEVSGLTVEQDVVVSPRNTDRGQMDITILPGVQKNGQCTVVRGVTRSVSFTRWINDSVNGRTGTARKTAAIVLMDHEDNPVRRYTLRNAWCTRTDTGTLTADEGAVLTETVTIAFEELVIE
ncbi:phage tail protein [Streptomyces longispororuber]|uniref:Phage tail protein n=1 Tax=Streptomyces longispororuber TaxID=68230 RepID=A0A919E053_9ACTN|nr:phage tail protein [Streptomyces longispororuber]GHE96673.1 phage tail protein [Streptomyces longispororuber]